MEEIALVAESLKINISQFENDPWSHRKPTKNRDVFPEMNIADKFRGPKNFIQQMLGNGAFHTLNKFTHFQKGFL